jgi:hypothetical protein
MAGVGVDLAWELLLRGFETADFGVETPATAAARLTAVRAAGFRWLAVVFFMVGTK